MTEPLSLALLALAWGDSLPSPLYAVDWQQVAHGLNVLQPLPEEHAADPSDRQDVGAHDPAVRSQIPDRGAQRQVTDHLQLGSSGVRVLQAASVSANGESRRMAKP